MTIIGFNFTKISAEKGEPARGKININRKCHPTGAELVELGTGQKAIRYGFDFRCEYKPKVGEIAFSGNITELVSEDASKEIMALWEEKKILPAKTLEKVMNAILNRCHVESLMLTKELNIPPPFNLPRVTVKEKQVDITEKK